MSLDYIATACATVGGMAFFGLPMVWPGQPMPSMDPLKVAHMLAASAAGPGLAVWWFFPLLGTRSGFAGVVKDALLLILAAAIGSMITAFLLLPTLAVLLLGPVFGFMMVMTPSLQTLICLSVFLTELTLGRLKPRE